MDGTSPQMDNIPNIIPSEQDLGLGHGQAPHGMW